MPETPDFDQIAHGLKNFIDDHPRLSEQNVRAIAEQLRQVWNARGAADITTVEHLPKVMEDVTDAIRSLDR